jgi:hypothetical protein
MTIPLLTPLNTSNPNRTLGCGYLDETDQIFKSEGLSIARISTTLVNCMTKHLSAIGVEEYTSELTEDEDDEDVITEEPISAEEQADLEINMWNSWAIYVSILLLILLGVGVLWGYRRDKRDEINYSLIRNKKISCT